MSCVCRYFECRERLTHLLSSPRPFEVRLKLGRGSVTLPGLVQSSHACIKVVQPLVDASGELTGPVDDLSQSFEVNRETSHSCP
ncbi:hypothetical protein SAMN05444695_1192 [Rhodococcus triatomae]|uniref:Uncharacterized protein n=1 Tax=Rhodococcus triatomae TaxID=300028 RepID=A0A1G8RU86_9NOCA|nr:hypothetical protein SAMN05444695_1192 [Rhodococcus triatomae]